MREFSLGLGLHHNEDSSSAFLRIVKTLGALPLLLGYASIKMPSTTMLRVGIQRWRMRSNDKQLGFEQRRVERVALLIIEGRGRLCTGGCDGQQSLPRSGWLGSRVHWHHEAPVLPLPQKQRFPVLLFEILIPSPPPSCHPLRPCLSPALSCLVPPLLLLFISLESLFQYPLPPLLLSPSLHHHHKINPPAVAVVVKMD